jgi:hypothetical protein
MRKHLSRTFICEGKNNQKTQSELLEEVIQARSVKVYSCESCGKDFTTSQKKYYHKLKCESQNNDIKVLMNRIDDMDKELKGLKTTNNNVVNGSHNNVQQNNNNNNNNFYMIRDFGNENTSYLSKEFLSSCFATKDVVRLIENIHCDKEHKENHNVRLRSLKNDMMEVKQNDKWMVTDSDDTLKDLIQSGYRILMYHSRRHKDHILEEELNGDKSEFEEIKGWLEDIYSNDKQQKPLKRRILLLFLSNKTLLLGKDVD